MISVFFFYAGCCGFGSNDRRLTNNGTFTEFTGLQKIPITTETSMVLLTKH